MVSTHYFIFVMVFYCVAAGVMECYIVCRLLPKYTMHANILGITVSHACSIALRTWTFRHTPKNISGAKHP